MKYCLLILSMLWTLVFPFCAHATDWMNRGLLFHAGFRPFLDGDIENNGISESVWQSAIFGKTNFDLPEYRKGLYGAMNFSGTSLYVTYQLLGGSEPWVMAIQVKKSCLNETSTFDSDYSVQLKGNGGRFSNWYVKHRAKYKSLETLCLQKFGELMNWKEGAPYSVSEHDALTQKETKECTPVINDFLNEEKIKVAFDVVNDDSWYIRDRDCIESIKGTPDQLLEMLFANQIGDDDNDVLDNLYGDEFKSGTFFTGSTVMVLKILAETTLLNSAHLARLSGLIQRTTMYLGKETEPKVLSLDSKTDNPFILRHALTAVVGALSTNHVAPFQDQLRARLVDMTQTLGAACQGAHGVKPEKKSECSRANTSEAKKLMDLLQMFEPRS